MLTDLRKVLSPALNLVVADTERRDEFGGGFAVSEGRAGGRSFDGDGDAFRCVSETEGASLSFPGWATELLLDVALLAWLADRGREDGVDIVTALFFVSLDDFDLIHELKRIRIRPCGSRGFRVEA